MKLKDAIEWAHRAEPAEVFIASHPRKTQNALWVLVAEVERLTAERNTLRDEARLLRKKLLLLRFSAQCHGSPRRGN